jgi:hypothetical protein
MDGVTPQIQTADEALFVHISSLLHKRRSRHTTIHSYSKASAHIDKRAWHHHYFHDSHDWGFIISLNIYAYAHVMIHPDEIIISGRIPPCIASKYADEPYNIDANYPLHKLPVDHRRRKAALTKMHWTSYTYATSGSATMSHVRLPLEDPSSIYRLEYYLNRLITYTETMITTKDGMPVIRWENVKLTEPLDVVTAEYKTLCQKQRKRK